MNSTIRNIIAVLIGIVLGSVVNMGIVMMSSSVIPLPEGVDPADMDSLIASIHLFEPKHFLMPFLAHALGTLVGAYAAARAAVTHKQRMAMVIGAFFLLGGIMNNMMIPGPTWFTATDILLAYIPMAWIGGRLVHRA